MEEVLLQAMVESQVVAPTVRNSTERSLRVSMVVKHRNILSMVNMALRTRKYRARGLLNLGITGLTAL